MLNLLDTILGAISAFDLITPIVALLQNLARGPTYTFRVPHRAGWGIYSVERILKEAGCSHIWGKRIVRDSMMLTVKKEDAQRGYWALHDAGVPVDSGVPESPKKARQPERASSLSDDLADFLNW